MTAGGEEAVYQGIVDAAAAVTGARYVNLSWLEHDGWLRGSVWTFTDDALIGRALTQARFVIPGFDPAAVRFRADVNGSVRRVLIEGKPCFGPFVEHVEGTVAPLIAVLAQNVLGLRWTHSVPLWVDGAVAGALAFHWHDRPHPRSLGVAEAFSAHAALTLEHIRLSEKLRTRASDLERSRERIASAAETTRREIAGTLEGVGANILLAGQRLLGCVALLASDPSYAATEVARVADELDRVRDVDVRGASHRLHPSLIAVGLVPALEMLSDSFGELDVSVTASPGVAVLDDIARNALPAGMRLALYRFVEDTVGGIAAANGRRVRVEVGIDRGALRTTVVDEGGRALPSLPVAALRGIRDRIERFDGAVEVGGDAGAARFTAVVPLPTAPRRAAQERSEAELFQRIADSAVGVTGARMASLSWYFADDGRHELGALAPLGMLAPMMATARRAVPGFDPGRIRLPVDTNPAVKAVLVEGRAVLARTADHAAGVIPPVVLRAATALLGFHWTYSMPLRVNDAIAGALALHFVERPAPATLAVADVLAAQAALTLANQRLAAGLRERAADLAASRERIAAAEERVRRETAELLHGRVQSRLLVVAHRLLETSRSAADDPAGAAAALTARAADLDRIREADLQQAIRQLEPAATGAGPIAALRHLARELAPALDVTVTADAAVEALDLPADVSLSAPARLALYRTLEEALANVARHAGTGAAAVHLEVAGGELRATVSDAGRGFDVVTARAGVGLRAMRDRVEELGGSFAIAGAPGRGTTVTLSLPLRRA